MRTMKMGDDFMENKDFKNILLQTKTKKRKKENLSETISKEKKLLGISVKRGNMGKH
jgi:hypothetical protein